MNFDAIVAPIAEFSSTDAGQIVTQVLRFFYELASPSNADAAQLAKDAA
ncbi:hypothetical protein [Corynebacterium tapiri]|nr:hypothetical protein [Corynebacterium tapiri]